MEIVEDKLYRDVYPSLLLKVSIGVLVDVFEDHNSVEFLWRVCDYVCEVAVLVMNVAFIFSVAMLLLCHRLRVSSIPLCSVFFTYELGKASGGCFHHTGISMASLFPFNFSARCGCLLEGAFQTYSRTAFSSFQKRMLVDVLGLCWLLRYLIRRNASAADPCEYH